MQIIQTEFSIVEHGSLWRLSNALNGYHSPTLQRRGIRVFEPLDVTFFFFPALFKDSVRRYYVDEKDIPLILSFLKLRDQGTRHPVFGRLELPWPDFIFIHEQSAILGISPDEYLKELLSFSIQVKQGKKLLDENPSNPESTTKSVSAGNFPESN
jgi:hypothetical protein